VKRGEALLHFYNLSALILNSKSKYCTALHCKERKRRKKQDKKMVSMSRSRVKGASSRLGRVNRHKIDHKSIRLGAAGVVCLLLIYILSVTLLGGSYIFSGLDGSSALKTNGGLKGGATIGLPKDPNHPNLHVTADEESESYNAIALDIIQTLQCHKLFNETNVVIDESINDDNDDVNLNKSGSGSGSGEGDDVVNNKERRRRLEEDDVREDDDADSQKRERVETDDFQGGGDTAKSMHWNHGEWIEDSPITGKHLFCLAAFSAADQEINDIKSKVHCDATHTRQQTLLDLWSTARSEMPEDVLLQTLQVAVEEERELVGSMVHLWAPTDDDGLEWQLSELNNKKNADEGGITGLTANLGSNKLYVDVGSCLGLTSMAVALLYPGTKIISIEAAAPNWLLQEMNWRCNDFVAMDQKQVILSGVGQNRKNSSPQMAKFMWRPHATTSTRAWTPASERQDTDVELTIKLRPWHALLEEAGIVSNGKHKQRIDVLNVDCEGCEYNLIPSLSEDDYDAISTVMGGLHWGYIPAHKKPSSQRAKETHERLCRHENFARTAKECCGFPDLPVISSAPGEVLVQEQKHGRNDFPLKPGTVRDVAGELCDGFDEWAAGNHLYDIESDWGWFQISSMAE
jgi:FkbM family methyltransferase